MRDIDETWFGDVHSLISLRTQLVS